MFPNRRVIYGKFQIYPLFILTLILFFVCFTFHKRPFLGNLNENSAPPSAFFRSPSYLPLKNTKKQGAAPNTTPLSPPTFYNSLTSKYANPFSNDFIIFPISRQPPTFRLSKFNGICGSCKDIRNKAHPWSNSSRTPS